MESKEYPSGGVQDQEAIEGLEHRDLRSGNEMNLAGFFAGMCVDDGMDMFAPCQWMDCIGVIGAGSSYKLKHQYTQSWHRIK